jgi:membrane dipeptidase
MCPVRERRIEMAVERREFLKVLAAGAFFPSGIVRAQTRVDDLFDQAIVIDSLAVGHEWDPVEYEAVRRSGYTGIQTTLPSTSFDVAIRALSEWNARIRENTDKLFRATKATDIEAAKRDGKMAVVLGFQNATMLEGRVENLDPLFDLGTRCIQLTYNSRNLLGDGCTERTNAGLSDFGVAVVERMNELGIVVDLSHCGAKTSEDGIAVSRKPAAFTHTFCEAIYRDHPRAKTDELIRAMSDRGGVTGITALGYFVGPSPDTTLEDYLNHIDHAVKVGGIDHVGLATDFQIRGIKAWATRENWYEPRLEGFKPSYRVRWPPWIEGLDEPERFRNVAHGLSRRGYRDEDVEKLLGQNWLRYFGEIFGG